MHILIINFNLKNLTHDEYQSICNDVANDFASIPGLVSKKWLSNKKSNTYGGVYLWENKASMDDYINSELYKSLKHNPCFDNIVTNDFEMLPEPSKATRAI